MGDIINIDDARINLNEDQVFELFLIFKYIQKNYFNVKLNDLMESLGKYSNMKRFSDVYRNLTLRTNDNGRTIVDLTNSFEKAKQERKIVEYPNEKGLFCVIIPDEELEKAKAKYSKHVLYLFDILMFYVAQDLEYGINGWDLVAEDEYIKVPNLPGVVTGEFVGKKKTKRVLKKVKEKAIDEIKNK